MDANLNLERNIMQQGRGTLILVLGIVAVIFSLTGCCPVGFIVGIVAWSMGNQDLRGIEDGTIDPADRGMISAGKIMGMVSVFVGIVIFGIFLALGVFGVLLSFVGM